MIFFTRDFSVEQNSPDFIYPEHNLKPQHIKRNEGSACTSVALSAVAAVFLCAQGKFS